MSYRDTREKGGKVFYNLLLLSLGVTLPYLEAGLSMKLGESVVVKVSKRNAGTPPKTSFYDTYQMMALFAFAVH